MARRLRQPDQTVAHFARTLRRLREQAGLSVTELARRADVAQPNLTRLEHGRRSPSLALTIRLARALAVPLAAFDPDISSPAPDAP